MQKMLRADAQRNRQRILDVAAAVFAEHGVDASVDEIARRAGVGVGTMYRHFGSRDALYVAVHRSQIEDIAGRGAILADEYPPAVALGKWVEEFLKFLLAKRDVAQLFTSVMASGDNPFLDLRAQVYATVRRLLDDAAGAGLQKDVDEHDIVTVLHGIALAAADLEQATRLASFVLAALKAT